MEIEEIKNEMGKLMHDDWILGQVWNDASKPHVIFPTQLKMTLSLGSFLFERLKLLNSNFLGLFLFYLAKADGKYAVF